MPFPEAFKKKMIANKKKPAPTDAGASYDAEAANEDEASASMAASTDEATASGDAGMSEDEEEASSDVPPELKKSAKVNPLKRWAFDKAKTK